MDFDIASEGLYFLSIKQMLNIKSSEIFSRQRNMTSGILLAVELIRFFPERLIVDICSNWNFIVITQKQYLTLVLKKEESDIKNEELGMFG